MQDKKIIIAAMNNCKKIIAESKDNIDVYTFQVTLNTLEWVIKGDDRLVEVA